MNFVNTKDKIEKDFKEAYNEIRYNQNTIGEGLLSSHTETSFLKRECAVVSVFSLMCQMGYYEEAKSQTNSKNPLDITRRMIDNVDKMVDNTFIRDEKMGAKI